MNRGRYIWKQADTYPSWRQHISLINRPTLLKEKKQLPYLGKSKRTKVLVSVIWLKHNQIEAVTMENISNTQILQPKNLQTEANTLELRLTHSDWGCYILKMRQTHLQNENDALFLKPRAPELKLTNPKWGKQTKLRYKRCFQPQLWSCQLQIRDVGLSLCMLTSVQSWQPQCKDVSISVCTCLELLASVLWGVGLSLPVDFSLGARDFKCVGPNSGVFMPPG